MSYEENEIIKLKYKIAPKYDNIKPEHYLKIKRLASLIRKIRKERNINSVQFSRQLGLSRQKLYELEEGYPNKSLYLYIKAFDLLGINIKIELDFD